MMEILQTIWSSLTTENPNIITIISIPLIFIEVYISMLLFTTLLNLNATRKQKILYVLSASVFSAVSRLFLPSPYNTYLNLFIIFLFVLFIFKTSILKSIICLFLPPIIEALIESILAKVYYCIFNIDYLVGGNIPLHRLIGTLIVYIIMFLFYILLKYFKINLSKLQVLDKKKKFWLTFSTLFGVLLIGLQVYMITFYVSYLPFFITIIFMVTLVAYFIISLYTMFTVSKLETTSMNLEEATLYTNASR